MRISKNDSIEEYFQWMCDLVYHDKYFKLNSYVKLLRYLFSRDFYYILEMDDNRFVDGINLRYKFCRSINFRIPEDFLDDKPCSVLEMMIALSFRCETQIECNPDLGDRTWRWFWEMIYSLGLDVFDDNHFDILEVKNITDIFLDRNYKPNGKGGLFTVPNCNKDLRNIEIWYQMMHYLNSIDD